MEDTLIEALRDEQQSRCAYGTRDGDGLPCDCKYGMPFRATSETTGCPELRAAIRILTADNGDRSGVASIARGVAE